MARPSMKIDNDHPGTASVGREGKGFGEREGKKKKRITKINKDKKERENRLIPGKYFVVILRFESK